MQPVSEQPFLFTWAVSDELGTSSLLFWVISRAWDGKVVTAGWLGLLLGILP